MNQPIFEHGGASERTWQAIWKDSRTIFLCDLLDAHIRCFDKFAPDESIGVGRTMFAIAREIERREITAAASLQPKWIEERFHRIDRGLEHEDYPGQMSDTVRPGRL